MPRKSADQWFAEYSESHQNRTNVILHWICVPVIFFCLLGFVWVIPVPEALEDAYPWFNWSLLAIVLTFTCYVLLSLPIAVGLLAFMALCHSILLQLDFFARWPVWEICLVLLAIAGVGQLIGHRIEKKKPAFRKSLAFLPIGPAWLMSRIYRKVRLKY